MTHVDRRKPNPNHFAHPMDYSRRLREWEQLEGATEVTIAPWAKANDEYVAWLKGERLAPTFNSMGAAQLYLDAVLAGTRRPEYPAEHPTDG